MVKTGCRLAQNFRRKERGETLTADQLAALQRRAMLSERGQEGVSSEDVQDVTSRETDLRRSQQNA